MAEIVVQSCEECGGKTAVVLTSLRFISLGMHSNESFRKGEQWFVLLEEGEVLETGCSKSFLCSEHFERWMNG